MISLDQVLLLQKKVETAVEKIKALSTENTQLKSDNDALRRTCAELTKAVSDKSELVSSMESEQDKIEETILSTLNQLDAVENALLAATSSQVESEENSTLDSSENNQEDISQDAVTSSEENQEVFPVQEQTENQEGTEGSQVPVEQIQEGFQENFQGNSQEVVQENVQNQENQEQSVEQNNSFEGQFDIF